MKKVLKVLLVLFGLMIAAVLAMALLTPWMDRWGATDAEMSAALPGDELVAEPLSVVNRAVTVRAAPEQIFPWLLQMGAEKGGLYSYSWFETGVLQCELINADRIHSEWQNLQPGDQVKMCPGDFGPTPYEVAELKPNEALVLGHRENGQWVDLWQFVLRPQADGSTRLILRTTTNMTGGFWTIIHPGVFVMERGMLLGIRERAEATDLQTVSHVTNPEPAATPTPEVFIPLDPAPTQSDSDLPLTCQITDLNVYIDRAAGYCFAYPLTFSLGDQPSDHPPVLGPAIGSPVEPVHATLTVDVTPFDPAKSLDQQVDEYLHSFTVVDTSTLPRQMVSVGGKDGLMVDHVPVQLSWRIIFVEHDGSLYRLMYWPVDVPDAAADINDLYQTTLGSFAFLSK